MAPKPEAQPGDDLGTDEPGGDSPIGPADDLRPAQPDVRSADEAPTGDEPASDEERLAAYARDLVDRTEAVLADWVWRCVSQRAREAGHLVGDEVNDDVAADARRAGERARSEVTERLRVLVNRDIDDQATNPMSILRGAVRYPTEVLARAGVPPVDRDTEARRIFPDDHYDLTPATFADIDPSLHEPGLLWGAAKAHVHLSRRRAEGRR